MNIEETKKAIEVMQAFVDGKQIEYCYVHEDEWGNTSGPVWDWSRAKYRIKPADPKKVKLLAYIEDGYGSLNWYLEGRGSIPITWIRVPSEDKEVELP